MIRQAVHSRVTSKASDLVMSHYFDLCHGPPFRAFDMKKSSIPAAPILLPQTLDGMVVSHGGSPSSGCQIVYEVSTSFLGRAPLHIN